MGQGQAREFVIDQVRAGSPLNADTIGSVIDAVIASRGGISLFGLLFLIWGALGIFSAITRAWAARSRPPRHDPSGKTS